YRSRIIFTSSAVKWERLIVDFGTSGWEEGTCNDFFFVMARLILPFVVSDCREPVLAIEIRFRCTLDKVRPVIFLLIFSFLVKCSSKILPPSYRYKYDFIVEGHLEVGT